MEVDLIATGAFFTIAAAISLTLWAEYRRAQEKRERLEKFQRQMP